MEPTYAYYRDLFAGRPMPFAFVDLDLLNRNIEAIVARAGGMPLRVASKSVRCVALLERIRAAVPRYAGIMAYTAREAAFLAARGFDEILVAYPAVHELRTDAVRDALAQGKRIVLMVDCAEHVRAAEELGKETGVTVAVCLDIDMASQFPGIYFGVRRSPIRTVAHALGLWQLIQRCGHVALDGVMGYEAQLAGVQDRPPHARLKHVVVRALKRRSVGDVARRRQELVAALRDAGAALRFVNGGGTGSLEQTAADPSVTEVTAGSGFYSPGLFDHYAGFKHLPAAAYAIEIVRRPVPGIYTCHGGGYVASGGAGPDKWPCPYLPEGARLLAEEGAGEVQTPVAYEGPESLDIGAPVFLRHAKAGELCERFNTLLLVSGGAVVDEVPTYRGEGMCFL